MYIRIAICLTDPRCPLPPRPPFYGTGAYRWADTVGAALRSAKDETGPPMPSYAASYIYTSKHVIYEKFTVHISILIQCIERKLPA